MIIDIPDLPDTVSRTSSVASSVVMSPHVSDIATGNTSNATEYPVVFAEGEMSDCQIL